MTVDVRDEHPDLIDEAPAPFLAGLERSNQRMAARVMVGGRVPIGRVIAATDVPALQADPQVKPHTGLA